MPLFFRRKQGKAGEPKSDSRLNSTVQQPLAQKLFSYEWLTEKPAKLYFIQTEKKPRGTLDVEAYLRGDKNDFIAKKISGNTPPFEYFSDGKYKRLEHFPRAVYDFKSFELIVLRGGKPVHDMREGAYVFRLNCDWETLQAQPDQFHTFVLDAVAVGALQERYRDKSQSPVDFKEGAAYLSAEPCKDTEKTIRRT